MIINSRNDKEMPMGGVFTPTISRIIKPKRFVVPYYTQGIENVAWVNGRTEGTGDRQKLATHLYLLAGHVSEAAVRSYSTVLVDLTNIETLFIDWENTGVGTVNNRSYFQVSPFPASNYVAYVAQLELRDTFARQPGVLDVSAVSGEYYVIVFARDHVTDDLNTSEIRTYRVWGEG